MRESLFVSLESSASTASRAPVTTGSKFDTLDYSTTPDQGRRGFLYAMADTRRQHARKIGEGFGHVVFELYDRRTDRQTYSSQ